MNMEFRPIKGDEAESAYRIICDATEWLRRKKIKQWTEPLPRQVFDARQSRDENYGLFADGVLSVSMSLILESVPYWEKEIGPSPVWWLCTLATSVNRKGEGLGEEAVRRACQHLKNKGVGLLWLDCVMEGDFLQNYYFRLGFATVAEKTIDFPKCGRTGMVLMKIIL